MNFINVVTSAKIPTRASENAAGYDLASAEPAILAPGERKLIKTGVHVQLPTGYYGKIEARSGNAVKHGIITGAGVIDADYTGEIGVLLFNAGTEQFYIKTGDRIAQMIVHQHWSGEFQQVDTLNDTARGDNGFGSTGRG